MIDSDKPGRRGQLREPISVACCRWTPINFAELDSGEAARAPGSSQDREKPSDAAPAATDEELSKTR